MGIGGRCDQQLGEDWNKYSGIELQESTQERDGRGFFFV